MNRHKLSGNRIARLLVSIVVGVVLTNGAIAATPAPAGPLGSLMMIGGGERDDNALLWHEFVRLAGGAGKQVAIFPTASGNPQRTGALYTALFQSFGLNAFVVPLSPLLGSASTRTIVADPEWVERVHAANVVFLAGGNQLRYRQALLESTGIETPLLHAIRSVYQRGGLIAGTSAGTAIMSRLMFIEAERMVPVLIDGARMHREIDLGFGFLPPEWFVDQHFLTRGRFGRLLVAMQSYDFPFGVGIDEDTALVVEHGSAGRVVGYHGIVFMDASHAEHDPRESRFNWRNMRLSYLGHGDRIDLRTHQVTPGPEKRDEFRIDPQSADFKPYYTLPQFYTDIFANTVLRDLMVELTDSAYAEAIGLAFDGDAARKGPVPGFELRFSRDAGTSSWDSPIAPADAATVLGVRLDIRPIEIKGPLYR